MPTATLTRDQVVALILATFRQYGYSGTSLARLSQATGLGRSSLYHYFPKGKEDMAHATMAAVFAWSGAHLLPTLSGAAPPRARLQQFAAKLSEFYQGGERTCLTDVFSIGEAGAIFQQHLHASLRRLIQALASVIEEGGFERAEAQRRAEDAVVTLQGSLVVARALGSTAPFARMIENFPDTLLRP